MPIELSDDGTLDTVLKCSDCGEEFRYNFDPDSDGDASDSKAYNDFVQWAIDNATDDHDCEAV